MAHTIKLRLQLILSRFCSIPKIIIILLGLGALYAVSGFYNGFPGDPLEYLQYSFVPEKWARMPVHIGYFALLHCVSFWVQNFDHALIIQTLLSVTAGTAGLAALYGIGKSMWENGCGPWTAEDIGLLSVLSLGLCGGYWLFATTGEVLGVQNACVLISGYFFLKRRWFPGAGFYCLACTVTPLTVLTMPFLIFCWIWGLRGQRIGRWGLSIASVMPWILILLTVYRAYGMVPPDILQLGSMSTWMSSPAFGRVLPEIVIPWSKALSGLGKMYVRMMPALLIMALTGCVVSLYAFRTAWKWHVLSAALVGSHIFLIRHLDDAWTHTQILLVCLAGYAAIGTASIAHVLEKRCKIRRWITAGTIFLIQFLGTSELFIAGQHVFAASAGHLGKEMVLLDDAADIAWFIDYDALISFSFSVKGRQPGDGISSDFYPQTWCDLHKSQFSETWQPAQNGFEKQAVYIVLFNKYCFGPVLRMLMSDDRDLQSLRLPAAQLKKIKQVGVYGVYRMSR